MLRNVYRLGSIFAVISILLVIAGGCQGSGIISNTDEGVVPAENEVQFPDDPTKLAALFPLSGPDEYGLGYVANEYLMGSGIDFPMYAQLVTDRFSYQSMIYIDPGQDPDTGSPECGFAIYGFDLSNYDGYEYVSLGRDGIVGQDETVPGVWLGVSNMNTQCWDWFEMPGNYIVEADLKSRCDESGLLYCAVVTYYPYSTGFGYIHIGPERGPIIQTVTPDEVVSGQETTIELVVDTSEPYKVEWDLGGAGYFLSWDRFNNRKITIMPGEPGIYSCSANIRNYINEDSRSFTLTVLPAE
ncbi:hypothetical protein JW859_12395 [bacterium]|nr:hypothetical protein [bacterium]